MLKKISRARKTNEPKMDDSQSSNVTDLLWNIDDPALLANAHEWTVKLTTGEPSARKTDLLRPLKYTSKSDGIVGEPFSQPPPAGPLAAGLEARRPYDAATPIRRSLAAGSESQKNDDPCPVDGFKAEKDGDPCSRSDGREPKKSNDADDKAKAPDAELTALVKRTTDGNDDGVSLHVFIARVQRHTRDGGALMRRVADQMLGDFRQMAEALQEDRALKLNDILAKEQVALLLRYRNNGQRMLSRAQILQDFVRELMPAFQYEDFVASPDEHIKAAIAKKRTAADEKVSEKKDGTRGDKDDATTCPDEDKKTREDGDGETGGDEGGTSLDAEDKDDGDDIVRQKKLLYALNWLRSEVERVECENAALGKRHDALVAAVGAANRTRTTNECRTKSKKHEARSELDDLRKRSAKQVARIDGLVEKIAMATKTAATNKNHTR